MYQVELVNMSHVVLSEIYLIVSSTVLLTILLIIKNVTKFHTARMASGKLVNNVWDVYVNVSM